MVYYLLSLICFEIVVDSGGVPVTKKRRLSFTLPTIEPKVNWSSEFNLDGKVETSQKEVGDVVQAECMLEVCMV